MAKEMIPEEALIVPRGQKEISFDFHGFTVEATVRVLTNKEVDDMGSRFVSVDGGETRIDAGNLLQARVVQGLLDLNSTYQGKPWKKLNMKEKKEYVDVMHPDLRKRIAEEIMAKSTLSEEERGFLLKQQ